MITPALKIIELTYGYKSNWSWKRIPALKPFSLDVKPGESFGFLGHNGAGKTTAIKCILDLIHPTSGSISIFGHPSTIPDSRREVGYIPEQPYFYDNLTVLELLRTYGELLGLHASKLTTRVDEVLEQVGLTGKRKVAMRTLSKGLTQRVALAQAIIGNPKLLILDEPFSGLDPIGRREFREIFFKLKKQGTTIFISSHILSDVEHLCDRVSILVKGELKGVFAVNEIPTLGDSRYELIISNPGSYEGIIAQHALSATHQNSLLKLEYGRREQAEDALKIALEQKIAIQSFEFIQGNLEELFVKLVRDQGVKAH